MSELMVNANPTKSFFISMLTRDIDLKAAIAELVDNAIDGARKFRKMTEAELSVEVEFTKEIFRIKDSCGGISVDDARSYCFRFGRDSKRQDDLIGGIGVFGIGMKRALFRMGNNFIVKSVTPTEHFVIKVDVKEWLEDEGTDWTFEFDDIGQNEENDLSECGTEIIVSNLHPSIGYSFNNVYFRDEFLKFMKTRIGAVKSLNLRVSINNIYLDYADEKIIFDKKYKPFVNNTKKDDVNICVVAACASMGELKKAGWYVFCNNRMVLYANQDEITGWGCEGVRLFHPAFAAFRGYVFFESENLKELPWNTTKTGIDTSSKYYQFARDIMADATKKFIEYRSAVEDYVKGNDGITTDNIFKGEIKSIFTEEFKEYCKESHSYEFPQLVVENFPIPGKPLTSISFRVEKEKAEQVMNRLDINRKNKMGEYVFNYFYEREIDSDE